MFKLQGDEKMNNRLWCNSKELVYSGFILLVTMLLFGGCTVGKDVTRKTIADAADDAQVESVSTRPIGFVLKEKADLGMHSRRNFKMAVNFLNNRDFDKAIDLLEKVIEDSPGVTAPYINIAIAYRKTGKPELAEEHLKTALKLFPKHPVASNEYGLLLRSAGRFDEAKNVYELTIGKYPEYLPARKNLAILCDLYLNDVGCALEQYELYSQISPGDKKVKIWITELRLRHGR